MWIRHFETFCFAVASILDSRSNRSPIFKINPFIVIYQSKFQHSELVGKKDKLSRLDSKRKQEAATRNVSMSASREALRKRRELSMKNEAVKSLANIPIEEKKRKLDALAETDGGEELFSVLPELIKKRTDEVMEDTSGLEHVCAALRRRIAGYQKSLDLSMHMDTNENNGVSVMQQ